ncbi:hypothetical protein DM806_25215 [Sphingobium lactosutens]|nr:hypothetical protein [Sphingobium lactosutens]
MAEFNISFRDKAAGPSTNQGKGRGARAFSKQKESSAGSENAENQKLRAAEPMQSDRKLL